LQNFYIEPRKEKTESMQKEEVKIEFIIKTSPSVLYNLISTPDGLCEWLADNVNIKNNIYTFIWDGSEEKARLLKAVTDKLIKYQWINDEEDEEDCFFQFEIELDPMTQEISFTVTDFAEDDEVEEVRFFWENQVNRLKYRLGSS